MAPKKTTKATTTPKPTEDKPKISRKKAAPVSNGAVHGSNGTSHPSNGAAHHGHRSSHEEIATRAYFLWEERGRVHGSAEHDWQSAESAGSR